MRDCGDGKNRGNVKEKNGQTKSDLNGSYEKRKHGRRGREGR